MNLEAFSIIMALCWLACGVGLMWFSHRVSNAATPYPMNLADEEQVADTQEQAAAFNKAYGRALSFYSLLLFINAALSVYLLDGMVALILCFGLAVIGAIAMIIAYARSYKKYGIHDKP